MGLPCAIHTVAQDLEKLECLARPLGFDHGINIKRPLDPGQLRISNGHHAWHECSIWALPAGCNLKTVPEAHPNGALLAICGLNPAAKYRVGVVSIVQATDE